MDGAIWVGPYVTNGYWRRPVGCLEAKLSADLQAELTALRVLTAGLEARIREIDDNLRIVRPGVRLNDESPQDIELPHGWMHQVFALAGLFYGNREFTNQSIYNDTRIIFQRLYPENQDVESTIRKSLQQLRDANLIVHVAEGVWRRA